MYSFLSMNNLHLEYIFSKEVLLKGIHFLKSSWFGIGLCFRASLWLTLSWFPYRPHKNNLSPPSHFMRWSPFSVYQEPKYLALGSPQIDLRRELQCS